MARSSFFFLGRFDYFFSFLLSILLLLVSGLQVRARLEVGVVEEAAEQDKVREVHQRADGDVVVGHVALTALSLGLKRRTTFYLVGLGTKCH